MPTTNEMICCKLRISYDRGTSRNNAADLGLESRPVETEDGGLVRGLGSHWRSSDAKEAAKALATIEGRIRREFATQFPPSPIEGIYCLTGRGAGKAAVDQLNVPAEIAVHVTEFSMGVYEALPPAELADWAARVKKQLLNVSLGRKKEAGSEGLVALERLAGCPIFAEKTRAELLGLIADAKLGSIDRVEVRRFLGEIDVSVDVGEIAPRRVKIDPVEIDAAPVRRRSVKIDPVVDAPNADERVA